jgi:hypothetical protein
MKSKSRIWGFVILAGALLPLALRTFGTDENVEIVKMSAISRPRLTAGSAAAALFLADLPSDATAIGPAVSRLAGPEGSVAWKSFRPENAPNRDTVVVQATIHAPDAASTTSYEVQFILDRFTRSVTLGYLAINGEALSSLEAYRVLRGSEK